MTRSLPSLLSLFLFTGCMAEPLPDTEELLARPMGTPGTEEGPCTLPNARPLVVESTPRTSLDTAGFISDVVSQLGDDYMGYSVLLIGSAGSEIASAKYGWARTRCEPEGERVFNHNTQTAWGSVTKVLTTALVIDKVERSSQSLDEEAWTNLPSAWRTDMVNGSSPHQEVRIRDLLSHMSGFAGSAPATLRERITGPLEKPLSQRNYSNANFGLFHYMGRFFREGYFDNLEANWTPADGPLDDYLEAVGVSIYRDTMQDRVADPLGISFSCNTPEHDGSN